MLDVHGLRILRAAVDAGSISAAARRLSLTPSALSQQVAKLERAAGTRLLERTARGVRPTAAGARLAEHAEDILARLAAAEAELLALTGRRRLRVGAFPTAAASLLPPALAALAAAEPDVGVTVEQADPLVCLERLRTRDLDLALLFEYDRVPLPEDGRIARRTLGDEPLLVVLPAEHPAARASAVVLAELADEAWLCSTRRSSCHPFTERTCRAAGFAPRVAAEFDDYAALIGLVAAGVGVAFAPASALRALPAGVTARPVAFTAPRRRIHAAWRAADGPDSARDRLVALLAANAAPAAAAI